VYFYSGMRDAWFQVKIVYSATVTYAEDGRSRNGDGSGRGPRTKLTLSRGNETGGLASVDDSIQTGIEGLPSAILKPVVFAERVEFRLFRDLELRFDLDPCFDFELRKDVECEDCVRSFDSAEPSCDAFSELVGYAGTRDNHE